MNLIEALRTGKPLRRPIAKHMGSEGTGYLGSEYVLGILVHLAGLGYYAVSPYEDIIILTAYDIRADDWEVKE